MPEKILFQQDRLTVSDAKITVGNATIFYSSVSSTSIYDGHPFVKIGIVGIICMLPTSVMLLMGSALLGQFFPFKILAITLLPGIGMVIFGFTYKVKCLYLGIAGNSVAVLESKERFELEVAQRAIEEAKRAYESKEKKA